MKTRILGKDLKVSAVGLGCMGMTHASGAPADVKEMTELLKEGKILHWGISEVDEEYLRRAHKVCPVTAIQNRLSMMYRDYEKLFPVLEELQVGFVAFSPLANGFLTACYKDTSQFEQSTADFRSSMPQFTKEGVEQNADLLELIRTKAKEKDATPAQISLAWMLAKRPYIVPIPGSRKLSRLQENLGAAEIELTKEEVAQIDDALDHMTMSQVFGGHR